MDCIWLIRSEHARLEGRRLGPAFHLAVIEEALNYINARISSSDGLMKLEDRQELGAACTEALDALADLRAPGHSFPV